MLPSFDTPNPELGDGSQHEFRPEHGGSFDDEDASPPVEFALDTNGTPAPVCGSAIASHESSSVVGRCPCCLLLVSGPFVCSHCIQRGVFFHSSPNSSIPLPHTFCEIKSVVLQRKKEALELQDRCQVFVKENLVIDVWKTKRRVLRERLEMLHRAVDEKRSSLAQGFAKLRQERDRMERLQENLQGAQSTIMGWDKKLAWLQGDRARFQEKLVRLVNSLVECRVRMVRILMQEMFPVEEEVDDGNRKRIEVEEKYPQEEVECGVNTSLEDELEDACRTVLVDGQWVAEQAKIDTSTSTLCPSSIENLILSSCSSHEAVSSIVGIHVPSEWNKKNLEIRKGVVVASTIHASQLVELLSFILGIRVPFQIPFRTLSRIMAGAEPGELSRVVAKVRFDVCYLCLASGGEAFNRERVVANLVRLQEGASLGHGLTVAASEMDLGLEEDDEPLLTAGGEAFFSSTGDSDTDDEECLVSDWESVPMTHVLPSYDQQYGTSLGVSSTSARFFPQSGGVLSSLWRMW